MLVNIYIKFHDILNGFQVTERTRLCDGQTDRRTDGGREGVRDGRTDGQTDGQSTRAKTICVLNLKGGWVRGDIIL